MNHCHGLVLILLLAPFFMAAQNLTETQRVMSQGTHTAFVYSVEGIDAKEMEDVLTDYLKEFKSRRNPKYDRRTKEFFLDDGEISELSRNTIDVYASIESKDKQQHDIVVWFDMGGSFLNGKDHAAAVVELQERWFPELGNWIYNRQVELELELEEDKLKEMNKAFDRLQRDQKKLEDDIAEYQQKIKEAEQDLKDNIAAQQEMEKVIKEQQEVVKSVEKKKKN